MAACGAVTRTAYWTDKHPCGKAAGHRGPHIADVNVYAPSTGLPADEWLIWRDGEDAKLYARTETSDGGAR